MDPVTFSSVKWDSDNKPVHHKIVESSKHSFAVSSSLYGRIIITQIIFQKRRGSDEFPESMLCDDEVSMLLYLYSQ